MAGIDESVKVENLVMKIKKINTCLAFLILFVSSSLTAEMLTNGSFEDGFTDWRKFAVGGAQATFEIVTDSYDGENAASMHVTYITNPLAQDFAIDRSPKDPGTGKLDFTGKDRLEITFAAKKMLDNGSKIQLTVSEFDADKNWTGTNTNYSFEVPFDANYHLFTVEYNRISSNSVYVNIGFRIIENGLKCTGKYYLDAVSVKEVSTQPVDRRPNIIQIVADDMGWGDTGFFGHNLINTPNIDQLAHSGISFTNFYSSATASSPARVGLMTGQYPAKFRIHETFSDEAANANYGMPDFLTTSVPTVTSLFKSAGYKTGHFGQWYLGQTDNAPAPTAYGIDTYRCKGGFNPIGGKSSWVRDDWQALRENDPNWNDDTFQPYSSELIIDEAINFIEQNKDDFFYLNIWLSDPGAPLNPTLSQLAQYDNLMPVGSTGKNHKGAMKVYYSVVSNMDAQIGRLMNRLTQLGIDGCTLVAFLSDNGPEYICAYNKSSYSSVGSTGPFRGRKSSLYEGGIRTPLIMRWPGHIPAGNVDNTTIFSGLDWLATACKIAEIDVAEEIAQQLDGEDVSAAVLGTPILSREPLMWEIRTPVKGKFIDYSPAMAIRLGQWKLLMNQDGSRVALYDIVEDPAETKNLAEENPDIVETLTDALESWADDNPWTTAPKEGTGAGVEVYPWPKNSYISDITGVEGQRDGKVDLSDLQLLFEQWGDCNDPMLEDCNNPFLEVEGQ
ncbi:Arylsulfatase [Limihaloglobus sulfuriphilus]|uniref:Arylsulfatase n=1 Tax=Limihaloglobus sulfuriphilus TaxID=1851148 RepID=A0A1Q2MIH5_9BACT|nr:sulfatase-like hydrolase/transferase [Limihaloglobus sulfuriphilus]AQQ72062.1 Arylsulfatase [Limihaloglobus sulfuriphilus]